MASWDTYRRQYVNPAGFRKDSPGVWVRENEDGTETEFQPFRYLSEHGKQQWQVLAEQGLGPDETPANGNEAGSQTALLPAPRYAPETLLAIIRLTKEKGYPPCIRELGAAVGITVAPTSARLQALEETGWVVREYALDRTVVVSTHVAIGGFLGGQIEQHGNGVIAQVELLHTTIRAVCPRCECAQVLAVWRNGAPAGEWECAFCGDVVPGGEWESIPE